MTRRRGVGFTGQVYGNNAPADGPVSLPTGGDSHRRPSYHCTPDAPDLPPRPARSWPGRAHGNLDEDSPRPRDRRSRADAPHRAHDVVAGPTPVDRGAVRGRPVPAGRSAGERPSTTRAGAPLA